MEARKLADLVQDLTIENSGGNLSLDIQGLAYDSRKVASGYIFVCITGYQTDGHNYIVQAIEQGAIAILVEKDPHTLALPTELLNKVTWLQVANTRSALAWVSARFYDFPAQKLSMIGVTGTNGKTTTTHLIEAILKVQGHRVGLIGTINNKVGDEILPVTNTTPQPLELQQLLAMMQEKQAEYAVMEVSSHALELGRVEACEFDVAVFTNLTQDHLDFHQNMENYRAAKTKLFANLNIQGGKNRPKYGIINIDDQGGQYILGKSGGQVLTYGIKNKADVQAEQVAIQANGVVFTVKTPKGQEQFKLNLTGMFNVYNALAAISVGLVENIELAAIKKAMEALPGVAGRFELVEAGQPFSVIVDYAHTPDGLENILHTAREFAQGRIITVFGCGGDRDRTKRPLMGALSARLSDYSIITSDNPRSEDPEAILEDIEVGVREVTGSDKYLKITDRRKAIEIAIKMAQPHDVILIAGKGHETYQILGKETIHFDDREVARECLQGFRGE